MEPEATESTGTMTLLMVKLKKGEQGLVGEEISCSIYHVKYMVRHNLYHCLLLIFIQIQSVIVWQYNSYKRIQ